MINEKYGKLTIIERVQAPEHLKDKKSIYYKCICDCGNEKVVRKTSIVDGRTISCGCEHRKLMKEVGKMHATHGLSKTRFFRIWSSMKNRCENPKDNQYRNYGLKGVIVIERWQTFQNFVDDMHESYLAFEAEHGEDSATIDRINSEGNYEPSNCRWASQLQQARNRNDNISIEVNGVEYSTLKEVAEAYDLNYMTVVQRYHAGKRDAELVKPPKSLAPKTKQTSTRGIEIEVKGVVYSSLTALQKAYPYISLVSISKRYKKGLRGADLIHSTKN